MIWIRKGKPQLGFHRILNMGPFDSYDVAVHLIHQNANDRIDIYKVLSYENMTNIMWDLTNLMGLNTSKVIFDKSKTAYEEIKKVLKSWGK